MKSRRIPLIVLAVILIAMVALGVHLLHKRALAQNVEFKVLIEWTLHDDDDVEQVRVRTHAGGGGELDNFQAQQNGLHSWYVAFVPNPAAVTWSAKVIPTDLPFDEPNPCNFGNINWQNPNVGTFHEVE